MQCPQCNSGLSAKDINNGMCPTCSHGIVIKEDNPIPDDFDYMMIASLSNESRQKLITVRPETLGQASRIDGVRSSDISLLCIKLKQYNVPRETL